MALTGYVPQVGERDLERIVRSLRNAHERLLLTGPLLAEAEGTSVAAIEFTNGLDDTYDVYHFEFDLTPVNDGDQAYMVVRENGVWHFSNYHYAGSSCDTTTTLNAHIATTSTIVRISLGVGNASGEGASGWLRLYDRAGGAKFWRCCFQGIAYGTTASLNDMQASGGRASANSVDGIRFGMTSGNVSGRVRMYGVPKL